MIILQCYFLHDQVELQGDLQIFGLITLPLVINYVLLGWAKKLKVLVRSVRSSHACNSQDMWKWKSVKPTTSPKAGYAPVNYKIAVSSQTNSCFKHYIKHKLWKPVRPTRFRKPQFPVRFKLFFVPLSVFAVFFLSFFMFLAIILCFAQPVCCRLPLFEFW